MKLTHEPGRRAGRRTPTRAGSNGYSTGSGMVTGFPFADYYGLTAGFPCGLGLANSCSTAVDTKPFSTSVIQELVRIFATTTKICASGGSMPACARHFDAHHRTLLLTRVSSQGG